MSDPQSKIVYHDLAVGEMNSLSTTRQDSFITSLKLIARKRKPLLPIKSLTNAGNGVYELIINGKQAHRCVYYTKLAGQVVVLHVAHKKVTGQDNKLINTAKRRLSDFLEGNSTI